MRKKKVITINRNIYSSNLVGGSRLLVPGRRGDVDDVGALLAVVDRAAVGKVPALQLLLGADQPAAGRLLGVHGRAAVQNLLNQESVALLCKVGRRRRRACMRTPLPDS